jgi:tetratricopeptide (TPR) repeat protein
MVLAKDDSRPVKLLGSTLQLQGKHQQAERVFERAQALDPTDPYVLVALGEIKLKSLKLEEAIPIFEKLFELDPKGMDPAANRGRDLVQSYYRRLAGEDS